MNAPIDIIPHAPEAIALDVLAENGWQAWLVGGWVRDAIMHRAAHDADIATNAPWQAVERAFRQAGFAVHETGVAHGTVTAVVRNEPIEITTYRVEGPYSDARHPDYVEFVDRIELDLARRDFTMNAIAFNPAHGIVDPFGGMADIESRTIRSVGDPARRFAEDPLRIMRAARFASQLGFAIEEETRRQAHGNARLLNDVAKERIGAELTKLLMGEGVQPVIESELDIVGVAIPELVALRGFTLKSKRHAYDLLGHLAHSAAAAPRIESLRWAALLHDVAKPQSHHDHAARSAKLARSIMSRLRLGRTTIDQACDAIAWHQTPVAASETAVRLFAACLGGSIDRTRRALLLQRSDAQGHGPGASDKVDQLDSELRMLDMIAARGDCISTKQLAIGGNEVARACGARGPEIGQTLQALLCAVIEGQVRNEKQPLLDYLPTAFQNADENIFQKRLKKFLTQQ